MNLNKDRVLNQINCFRVQEKYTDTVLKFSDGHIYAHWIILEAHGSVWWTLARDTNSDNIVEVIIPDVSVAEGLVFLEEVYSNISSLKILNPNSDCTVQNLHLQLDADSNNNTSYDIDIENDPDVELPIRSLEDQQSRLMTETESESQTILNSEDIIDDDDDEEESEIRVELPSTTQGCTELTTLGCRPISASQIQNSSVEQKKSTMCCYCGKTFDTSQKMSKHMRQMHDDNIFQCEDCNKICKGRIALNNHKRSHKTVHCNNCNEDMKVNTYDKHRLVCHQVEPTKNCPYENCNFVGYYKADVKKHMKKHKRNGERHMCLFCDLTFFQKK